MEGCRSTNTGPRLGHVEVMVPGSRVVVVVFCDDVDT